MNDLTKSLLIGMSSAFAIFPSSSISVSIDTRTDAEKLSSDWKKTGQAIKKSLGSNNFDKKED